MKSGEIKKTGITIKKTGITIIIYHYHSLQGGKNNFLGLFFKKIYSMV